VSDILRVTGTTSFPLSSGTIDFTDAEVDDVALIPFKNQVQSFSQEDDLTIYDVGPEHWIIDVTFVIENYNTLLKLSDLRNHGAPLTIYPSMRDDPSRSFEVLWLNPNDFVERLKRGYQVLGYAFNATFREPLGVTCSPPSEYGNIGAGS